MSCPWGGAGACSSLPVAFAALSLSLCSRAFAPSATSPYSAAVRLRSTYNASISLLEQASHTDGHVNTYLDPLLGQPVDYGVQRYWDHGPTREFFAQFDVSIVPAPQPAGLRSVFVDLYTGKQLVGYVAPTREAEMKATRKWRDVAGRYDEVFVPGFWMLDGAMPEELVRPFGEFVEREGVEDLVPLMNAKSGGQCGGCQEGLAFPSYAATGLLEGSEIAPTSGSNSGLYTKTAAWLGSDLLLNTRMLEIRRPPHSCSCSPKEEEEKEEDEVNCKTNPLIQNTLTKQTSLIYTNHLLITAQPSPDLLSLLVRSLTAQSSFLAHARLSVRGAE
ncbi:hypothetical protein TI39_contig420g00003 [Zymoseptoria brevis]|uniref:Uncharacterized protein n=1 Tax=Zymoseptoria brevis TaxID=1047168 RepID=A0A0F4GLG9_9PEZI|nr:hypothetical protein TI39_contig420g00003 [Zymoseptoria brevis]